MYFQFLASWIFTQPDYGGLGEEFGLWANVKPRRGEKVGSVEGEKAKKMRVGVCEENVVYANPERRGEKSEG